MSQAQKDRLDSRKDPKRTSAELDSAVVPFREPDQLEGTLPPTPLRDLLAGDGASVYVLSDDASLLATAREAGGEQYPVFPAGSWAALREAVAEKRCGIALLDVDSVPGTLGDRLTELAGLRPALVTLLASTREAADGLINLLSERKIHRLLIKPPTVGITRLLLESSVSRHIELRQQPQPASESVTSTARKGGLAGWPSWLLAGGLVIGVLGTVALTTLSNREDVPAVSVTMPVAEQSVPGLPPEDIAAPLAAAVDESPASLDPIELTEPPADSVPVQTTVPPTDLVPVEVTEPAQPSSTSADIAASEQPGPTPGEILPQEATAAVLPAERQAPAAPEPADLEAMYASIEAALIAEDLDAAAALLTELQAFAPGESRLEFLSAQIGRERERIASIEEAAAAEAAALAAAPSELTSLIGLARARLDQAQLTTPDGDSALVYFRRAVAVNAESAEVQTLAADVGAAILTAAEIALAEGRFAEAELLFMEAQMLGIGDEDLVGLELSLVYARDTLAQAEQNALLTEAWRRLQDGPLFQPLSASALGALLELRTLNSEHAGLPPAFAELERVAQEAAEAALGARNWTAAETAIDALTRSGAAPSLVEPLASASAFGQTQEAYLAQAAPAGELNVIRFEPPVYPQGAVRRGTEGWVDLEFVVDQQGLPRDIVVTGAEPVGEFEAAALAAAETYGYEPFELDGQVYERRVSLRMRFALE